MAAGLFEPIQFFDNNGDPLNGGLVYTYEPGTGVTAAKSAYQDAALTVAHANPIVLSAFGRPPAPIWLSGETKVVITTSTGTVLMTLDNLNRDPAGTSGWATKGEGVLTKSAPYTLEEADDGKTVAATSGSWTLGALAAATLGDGYVVDLVNLGTGVITFDPNGSETVNGETSLAFGPGDGARLVCDGANWRLLRTRNKQRPSLRNRLINGDMRIDQRNAGAALAVTSANAYCVDRWAVAGSGGISNCTVQRVATSAPGGARFALRMLRSAGTYAGPIQIAQTIETANCYDLAGKTVTLSFRARKGSGYSGALSAISGIIRSGTSADEGVNGGTAGTWAGFLQDGSTTVVLTTDWQTFSVSAQIQANAQEVMVMIATANFSGTGGATDYVEVTDVQLEIGGEPTDFDLRPEPVELALCQRYFQKTFPMGTAPAQNAGATGSIRTVSGVAGASNRYLSSGWFFPVRMRIAPNVVTFNPQAANAQVRDASIGADCSAVSVNGEEGAVYVACTGNASTVAGSTLIVHMTASAEL